MNAPATNAFEDWPKLELTLPDGTVETYVLDLWPTSKALEWKQRIAALGLEPLAMLISEREYPWQVVSEADLAVVARKVMEKLDAQPLARFCEAVTKSVFVLKPSNNGGVAPVALSKDYEARFRGRTLSLYRVVFWVLSENFRDFGTAVESIVAALRQRFSDDSKSASTSAPTPAETEQVGSDDSNPPSP